MTFLWLYNTLKFNNIVYLEFLYANFKKVAEKNYPTSFVRQVLSDRFCPTGFVRQVLSDRFCPAMFCPKFFCPKWRFIKSVPEPWPAPASPPRAPSTRSFCASASPCRPPWPGSCRAWPLRPSPRACHQTAAGARCRARRRCLGVDLINHFRPKVYG
jgi:hypothetical protein